MKASQVCFIWKSATRPPLQEDALTQHQLLGEASEKEAPLGNVADESVPKLHHSILASIHIVKFVQ
eukprot:m.97914 g.97914  ORF g.97914 m.97914 type:complete len:66 (+) comp51376_c0_seq5:268-465(+)